MTAPPITFDHPWMLLPAGAFALLAGAIAWRRGIRLPRVAAALSIVGLLLLCLAAGGLTYRVAVAGDVAVLVDCSPSTRSAGYRDRAALAARIDALLPGVPHRVYLFAAGQPIADDGRALTDLPADRTALQTPPGASAVVLFSDGQFTPPPALPPTFCVVDSALQAASDGRVVSLRLSGGQATAQVAVDRPRTVRWQGVAEPTSQEVRASSILRRSAGATEGSVAVALSPGDAWPENDQATIEPPPTAALARWFVTAGSVPAGFTRLAPEQLPASAGAYLGVSVIVIDNVAADAISAAARQRLLQYVRDLGGGVVFVGGDRAFSAGGYANTPLEALSPLASVPPTPSAHWMLLTDGSGSMAAPAASGVSRWQQAAAALSAAVAAVPSGDRLDVGSFAAALSWWTTGRMAGEVASAAFPPAGVSPGGPTNLEPALRAAAAHHDPALPGKLLLLSDTDAEVPDPAELATLLKSRRIALYLLATGEGRGLAALSSVAEQTGGAVLRRDAAAGWSEAATQLVAGAADVRPQTDSISARFADALAGLPERPVTLWNRTWLKPRAVEWAGGSADTSAVPLAAGWTIGEGRAAAAAFRPTPDELAALVRQVERTPRDPRFTVDVATSPRLRVSVDAIERGEPARYLNDLPVTLELRPADTDVVRTHAVPQTAPGRYELTLDAPTRPQFAAVRVDGRVIDRFAVAGRYAAEFEAIGLNRPVLNDMARISGGRVIEPNEATPIAFEWPRRSTPLGSWLAAGGGVALLAALVWWRRATA